jgi:hypothetical protein
MNPAEAKIWKLFTSVHDKYLLPSRQLCEEVSSGTLSLPEIEQKLKLISRESALDELPGYYWLGRADPFVSRPKKKLMNPLEDNVLRRCVKAVDKWLAELRDAIAESNSARLRKVAHRHSQKLSQFKIQDIKKIVINAGHLAKKDRHSTRGYSAPLRAKSMSKARTAKKILRFERTPKRDRIWLNKIPFTVDASTYNAFKAMWEANCKFVGISKYVRNNAASWWKGLEREHPELAAIVERGNGNSGYRLTIF